MGQQKQLILSRNKHLVFRANIFDFIFNEQKKALLTSKVDRFLDVF